MDEECDCCVIEDEYVQDESYEGLPYHSQPCSKRGISYTPPGWKKVLTKRKKENIKTACKKIHFED